MFDVGTGDGSSCSTNGNVVYCWGQLGGGATPAAQKFPTVKSKYARVGTGAGFACASRNDQSLECLGDDMQGQLGDGTNVPSTNPRLVLAHKFSAFHLSQDFACGVDHGAVACWGFNADGQLGNGTTVKSNVPVSVLSNGFTAASVGVGLTHACAIDLSGTLICWGTDSSGELGDGVPVPGPATMPVSVSAGWAVP
jgi:alpha-tubulin suppressor-like RCC1 family protein